jgi:hypothetical protein
MPLVFSTVAFSDPSDASTSPANDAEPEEDTSVMISIYEPPNCGSKIPTRTMPLSVRFTPVISYDAKATDWVAGYWDQVDGSPPPPVPEISTVAEPACDIVSKVPHKSSWGRYGQVVPRPLSDI